jgi:NAD(P)H-dependent flavin oxidoreductase YrpB (nitropropane dioxygenase family)
MKATGASSKDLNAFLGDHSQYHSQHLGKAEAAEICCGQGAGLIKEVESAEEVIQNITNSIKSRFDDLEKKVSIFL